MSSCTFSDYHHATATLSDGYLDDDHPNPSLSQSAYIVGDPLLLSERDSHIFPDDGVPQYQRHYHMLTNVPYPAPVGFAPSRSLVRRSLYFQEQLQELQKIAFSHHQGAVKSIILHTTPALGSSFGASLRSLIGKFDATASSTIRDAVFSAEYSPVDITPIKEMYNSPDWLSIESYIQKHSYLLDFLKATALNLKEYSSVISELKLEYFFDSSENWDKIYLVCQTNLTEAIAVCALEDEIFNKFFIPLFDSYKGDVVLSLV